MRQVTENDTPDRQTMTYPRRCPLCQTAYAGASAELYHATLHSAPGGTPSLQFPDVPGRVLTLSCLACRGEYLWDFFADAVLAGAPAATERRAVRQPVRRGAAPLTPSRGDVATAPASQRPH